MSQEKIYPFPFQNVQLMYFLLFSPIFHFSNTQKQQHHRNNNLQISTNIKSYDCENKKKSTITVNGTSYKYLYPIRV